MNENVNSVIIYSLSFQACVTHTGLEQLEGDFLFYFVEHKRRYFEECW